MAVTETLVDSLGGYGIKARYSDESRRTTYDSSGKNISTTYCTTSNTQNYANYTGGNGIVVTGTGMNPKSISTNIVELPVHSGTGVLVELDSNQEYAIVRALPELYAYHTTSPMMSTSNAIVPERSTGVTEWNNLGNNGTLATDNNGATGLDSTKVYRCTAKFDVTNSSGSVADITITASASFASGLTETVKQSVAGQADSLLMVWYVKGATDITFAATGLSATVQAGMTDFSICEVCDA